MVELNSKLQMYDI